jgi:tubulin polyglutamylase TTLL6/13
VVQEYLARPLLLEGLKSDLRIYVLVLSCDPLKIFIHKEGMVRFATQAYKPIELNSGRKSMENMFVHLTNYSLNKENDDFKAPTSLEDDTAHKRTLTSVFKTLRGLGKDVDKMWDEVKDIIIKTLLTVQPELSHNYRSC